MRSALVGAVESSAAALAAMVECDHPPELVVALPTERRSRHSDFADVGQLAAASGIAVHSTTDINAPTTLDVLRALQPDVVFVIGWSQICGPEFLALPAIGSVGFHPSLLPENRGRAVIPWTILQGLKRTGGTLFWLASGVDDGDMLAQAAFDVAPAETARSLYDRQCAVLQDLLTEVLPKLGAGEIPRQPQDHDRASYCARRTPADGLVDWAQSASTVWTHIRATGRPYPGAFSHYGGRRVVVWDADLVGPAPHCASPGQIVDHVDHGLLVQCGDGDHVVLRDLQFDGEAELAPPSTFRRHERFGIDWLAIAEGK